MLAYVLIFKYEYLEPIYSKLLLQQNTNVLVKNVDLTYLP